jgi:hypothetical protein
MHVEYLLNVVNKICLVGIISLTFWHTSSFAIPTVNSESDSEDRITVSLHVNEQSINEDSESYCRVYVNTNVAGYFSEGEVLTVKVFANSTQILSITDNITSAQENSGTINNNYNCQGAFGTATTHQIRRKRRWTRTARLLPSRVW